MAADVFAIDRIINNLLDNAFKYSSAGGKVEVMLRTMDEELYFSVRDVGIGISDEQLNPNGGSISIGHPYGMTGSRMTGALLRQLKRTGKRYGIVTMCIGGGQGLASFFERA